MYIFMIMVASLQMEKTTIWGKSNKKPSNNGETLKSIQVKIKEFIVAFISWEVQG